MLLLKNVFILIKDFKSKILITTMFNVEILLAVWFQHNKLDFPCCGRNKDDLKVQYVYCCIMVYTLIRHLINNSISVIDTSATTSKSMSNAKLIVIIATVMLNMSLPARL